MNLEKYTVNEEAVLNATDLKHIQNYRNIQAFLEAGIVDAMTSEDLGYKKLCELVFKITRQLNVLCNSYELGLVKARANNNLLEQIKEDIIKEELTKKNEPPEEESKKN